MKARWHSKIKDAKKGDSVVGAMTSCLFVRSVYIVSISIARADPALRGDGQDGAVDGL